MWDYREAADAVLSRTEQREACAVRSAGHKAPHRRMKNNLRSIQIRIDLELEEDANNDLRQLHSCAEVF
jgi:hypothetical protein